MFEKILVKSGSNPSEHFLPIADLIDMMFYYGEVHVLASQFELSQLLAAFGEDVLYHLISSKRLILHPCDQHVGAGIHGGDCYSLGLYSRNINTIDGLLYQFHRETVKNSSENIRFAEKFAPVLDLYKYSTNVQQLLNKDVYDETEFSRLTRAFINQYYPNYSGLNDIRIVAEPIQSQLNGVFRINCNLKIDELIKLHQENGYSGSFSLASILIAIGETAADCCFTAEQSVELMPTLRWNGLYKQRLNDVVNRVTNSRQDIENFHQAEAIEFMSPGVAFISGKLTASQLLDELLSKTSVDFREWLLNLPNDKNLVSQVNEAVRAANEKKWPITVGRILFQIVPSLVVSAFAGPVVGTFVGASTTILDAFVGDNITKGWSPRIFVDSVLRNEQLKND